PQAPGPERSLGGADRNRLRASAVRLRPVPAVGHVRAGDREGAALGLHEPGDRPRRGVRTVRLRPGEREAAPPTRARRARAGAALARDGTSGARRAALATRSDRRRVLPVLGLVLSAARGLLRDARVPHL